MDTPGRRYTYAAKMLLLLSLCSCGARHINSTKQKVRAYQQADYAAPDAERSAGSLWSAGSNSLFEDAKARRVGDILTIRVDERTDANRDAGTRLQRSSDVSAGVSSFLGAMNILAKSMPGLDANALIAGAMQNDFSGRANTTRSGSLMATLPVRIKKVLPNGDFYVEGHKVLLLNDEESFLYLSGVARSLDIEPDNTVHSSALADVELEFTGRGLLTQNGRQGWLGKFLNFFWPF